MAESSLSLLTKAADKIGVSASALARYCIERGLGLDEPGMGHADGRLWNLAIRGDPYRYHGELDPSETYY